MEDLGVMIAIAKSLPDTAAQRAEAAATTAEAAAEIAEASAYGITINDTVLTITDGTGGDS